MAVAYRPPRGSPMNAFRPPNVLTLFSLLCVVGCARNADQRAVQQAVARYAALPGLAATHHQGLQDELARLRTEGATPRQLDGAVAETAAPTPTAVAGPAAANYGDVEWSRFFRPDSLKAAAGRIDAVFPARSLSLTPLMLTSANSLLRQYEPPLRRYRRLTTQAGFRPGWTVSQGLAADTTFVEVGRLCARLEGLSAAASLARGEPGPALEAMERMLDTAYLLAAERRVVSRMTAVEVRRDALVVLSAVVEHEDCTDHHRRRAMNRIANELQRWPEDKQTWIGDRALGLQVYEMVRDDRLLSILTVDEKTAFRRSGTLSEMEEAVLANIDADEMFYLGAMRRIIAASDQPFYRRTKLLDSVRGELLALRDSPRYPFVADVILLSDFEEGHRRQAADRARVEAWLLALETAQGAATNASLVNPLTGATYRVSVEPGRVVVGGVDPRTDESIVVPLGGQAR